MMAGGVPGQSMSMGANGDLMLMAAQQNAGGYAGMQGGMGYGMMQHREKGLNMTEKVAPDSNIRISKYSVSAVPLDFSFLNLQDVISLRKQVTRSGHRKPIPESDDEEEQKKVSKLSQKFSNNCLYLMLCRMRTVRTWCRRVLSSQMRKRNSSRTR